MYYLANFVKNGYNSTSDKALKVLYQDYKNVKLRNFPWNKKKKEKRKKYSFT